MAFTKIAVSVTPLVVQIRRQVSSAAEASFHVAVSGAALGRSDAGEAVPDGRYQFTLSMMIMPPGLIFGSRSSVT